jgi:M6 family metalloprotease-like protein
MSLKPIVAKSLLISLAFTIIPSQVHSAQKITPGAICKVNEQTVTYLKKSFTCIKSGKKLIWSRGAKATTSTLPAVQPSPTPVASATPIPTPNAPSTKSISYALPTVLTDNIELCKIKEVSKSRGMTGAGFPEWNSLTPRNGTVKWALIPIDFPDLQGEANFMPRVVEQMQLLSDWFETVSEGKFKVEWVVADKWMTLPNDSTQYTIGQSANLAKAPNGAKLFKDAMAASDPSFNFKNIQTVNFILPSNQKVIDETSQGFPWDQAVKDLTTNEGPISSYSIPGDFMSVPGKTYWSYWAHEFGHAIGLPHIGTSRGDAYPFHALDILGNQDGPDKELSGWIRFIAGWLNNDRVYCKDISNLSELEVTIVPLSDKDSGIKLAIVPISSTKALLIESRRVTKFSCTTPTKRNGVLAYIYDATLGHNENFLIPYSSSSRTPEIDSCNSRNSRSAPPVADLLLRAGEKITVEGVTIEVLESLNYDKIRISKKS